MFHHKYQMCLMFFGPTPGYRRHKLPVTIYDPSLHDSYSHCTYSLYWICWDGHHKCIFNWFYRLFAPYLFINSILFFFICRWAKPDPCTQTSQLMHMWLESYSSTIPFRAAHVWWFYSLVRPTCSQSHKFKRFTGLTWSRLLFLHKIRDVDLFSTLPSTQW